MNKPISIFFTAVLLSCSLLHLSDIEASGTWMLTGSMTESRRDHAAALMNDGGVLVVGGSSFSIAEIYDPASGTFSPVGNTIFPHGSGPTATTLTDGRVLIAGGKSSGTSAEIYDPATGTFSPTGFMHGARYAHTATLLPDGRVLVVGGRAPDVSHDLAITEIYDPASDTFTLTGPLNEARAGHTATLLPNELVLIVAGGQITQPGFSRTLASAELYNPVTSHFDLTGDVIGARTGHTASLLPTGQVLVAGGFQPSNLYDPMTGSFSVTGEMNTARGSHTAAQLPSYGLCIGQTLVAGGYKATGPVVTDSAELYDSLLGIFVTTDVMNSPRQQYTATLLLDGRVLVSGGFDGNTNTSSAELFESSDACLEPVEVAIDIKPGNKRNPINPRSKGKTKVAILTTNTAAGEALDFDALQVDPATVRFGPDEAKAVRYRAKDVDHDGDADLLLYFKTRKSGIACGDTEATLTGETYDGQAITGTDAIKTVGCNNDDDSDSDSD